MSAGSPTVSKIRLGWVTSDETLEPQQAQQLNNGALPGGKPKTHAGLRMSIPLLGRGLKVCVREHIFRKLRSGMQRRILGES